MIISEKDYEKITKCGIYMFRDLDKFYENVLFAIDEFLGYPLTVYSVFNADNNDDIYVEGIYSDYIYREGLDRYKEITYKSDLFVQRVSYALQASKKVPIVTINDISNPQEFYDTDYGKYLKSINTPYQVIMHSTKSNSFPAHYVSIFKTAEQGDFTEYELAVLSKVGEFFSQAVFIYKGYQKTMQEKKLFMEIPNMTGDKIAILDKKGNMIYNTKNFYDVSSNLHELLNPPLYEKINVALLEETGRPLELLCGDATIYCDGASINISAYQPDSTNNRNKYYILSINYSDKASSGIESINKSGLYEKYLLTVREVEIVEKLIQGMSNEEIANSLCISVATVKFHMHNVFKKLGVNSRTAIISKLLPSQDE